MLFFGPRYVCDNDHPNVLSHQGYLSAPTSNPYLMSTKFTWPFENHVYKKSKTSFIMGSTPEFDMALFTVCFLKVRYNSTTLIPLDGMDRDIGGALGLLEPGVPSHLHCPDPPRRTVVYFSYVHVTKKRPSVRPSVRPFLRPSRFCQKQRKSKFLSK